MFDKNHQCCKCTNIVAKQYTNPSTHPSSSGLRCSVLGYWIYIAQLSITNGDWMENQSHIRDLVLSRDDVCKCPRRDRFKLINKLEKI